ncbi:hypothetical protein [Haladaptatus sp. T7]|uniref:hypothetical protein n=1 Tax=Haladaptatus sp. T7 TaxID=2029368 RepID=UPI0021A25BA0|nr:hypothetical protein [Haladaptatus sp. T7]GKZ15765.1 hypothetical protein HAL_36460 [Haladaptatus sp. T7]
MAVGYRHGRKYILGRKAAGVVRRESRGEEPQLLFPFGYYGRTMNGGLGGRFGIGRRFRIALTALLAVGLMSGVASAHQVPSEKFASPLPLSLLFLGAGATVALTAGWLAFTERTPAEGTRRTRVLTVPASISTPIRVGVRLVFFAGFAAALGLGVVGRQVPVENFATVFVWPVWFRGVALLSILLGTVWAVLSPWRTFYDGLTWLEGERVAVAESYPKWLASWPAFVGFVLLLGIFENLTYVPNSPRLTTGVLAVYAILMVLGSVLYGVEWFRRADPLAVLYRLFGRVASITIERTDEGGTEISLRAPWRGSVEPVRDFSLVAFVVTAVYTVSFDGFTNTRTYQDVLFDARDLLGTGPETSVLLYAAGLVVFVVSFALASWLVERLGERERGTRTARATDAETDGGRVSADDGAPLLPGWRGAARAFAPTVLPIAAAYEVAHNYTYVFRNLGQLVAVALEPVAPGVQAVNPLGWLSLPAFWGSQVLLIVLGHVIAVVAAHYVAVERFETASAARRGHLPLVVLMVGYTVLSLWIISQPVVS